MSALNALPVNKHYLGKVMDVAETMAVEVIVDILDVRGMKLVAKGARVTRALQEKLIMHKLKRPFESCVRVRDGVDANTIVAIAARLIDTSPPVARDWSRSTVWPSSRSRRAAEAPSIALSVRNWVMS